MTLPALPEALARACEVLPERFKVQDEMIWGVHVPYWHVFTFGEWLNFWPLDMVEPPTAYALMLLEAACREECEARGWGISQKIWNDGSGITTVNVFVPGCPYLPSSKGDTPAEALARALLSALEATS